MLPRYYHSQPNHRRTQTKTGLRAPIQQFEAVSVRFIQRVVHEGYQPDFLLDLVDADILAGEHCTQIPPAAFLQRTQIVAKTRLFSHHGEGCTLRIVHNRLANWVIAGLLMIQLVIGMQWQVAHADMVAPERQASGVDARHCPDHPSKDSITDVRGATEASTSAPSSHNYPNHKHDCCGSLDCQFHGGQGPGVLDLPVASAVCSTSFLLPFLDARSPVARTNEFTNELFRTPIA